MIPKTASIRSRPYPTAAFASTKRMNILKAASGRFRSAKLEQVLTTPTAKNRTSSPYPMAFKAPLMSSMTCQIPPPLKVAGSWVSSVQISASLSFHVSSAEFKLSIIQFPPGHLLEENEGERPATVAPRLKIYNQAVMRSRISLAKDNHKPAGKG